MRTEEWPEIFVAMPFAIEFKDVYDLGIKKVADELSRTCKRVDEDKFIGDVLSTIYGMIKNARLIIGEVTIQNANVYYELGYAHGLKKPVILVTRNISSVASDLIPHKHLIYETIVELRQKLEPLISAILENEH